MALEVHAQTYGLVIHNGRNRIRITEDDLDNCYTIHVYHGPGDINNLVYVLEDIHEAGDIINGSKIFPKPGMVVKNVSNQQVLQYLPWEIVDDKPIYHWQIPGTIYSIAGLDDDNYKILDVGEIDD